MTTITVLDHPSQLSTEVLFLYKNWAEERFKDDKTKNVEAILKAINTEIERRFFNIATVSIK